MKQARGSLQYKKTSNMSKVNFSNQSISQDHKSITYPNDGEGLPNRFKIDGTYNQNNQYAYNSRSNKVVPEENSDMMSQNDAIR